MPTYSYVQLRFVSLGGKVGFQESLDLNVTRYVDERGAFLFDIPPTGDGGEVVEVEPVKAAWMLVVAPAAAEEPLPAMEAGPVVVAVARVYALTLATTPEGKPIYQEVATRYVDGDGVAVEPPADVKIADADPKRLGWML